MAITRSGVDQISDLPHHMGHLPHDISRCRVASAIKDGHIFNGLYFLPPLPHVPQGFFKFQGKR